MGILCAEECKSPRAGEGGKNGLATHNMQVSFSSYRPKFNFHDVTENIGGGQRKVIGMARKTSNKSILWGT